MAATEPNHRTIPRADFGRVTVFFGEKNGKYPDANQVIVRGSDTQAAFDTRPLSPTTSALSSIAAIS